MCYDDNMMMLFQHVVGDMEGVEKGQNETDIAWSKKKSATASISNERQLSWKCQLVGKQIWISIHFPKSKTFNFSSVKMCDA